MLCIRVMARVAVALTIASCTVVDSTGASTSFGQERTPGVAWPVEPAVVLQDFDPPARAWGRGHRGIDLQAAPGTQVRSVGPGQVAFVGVIAGKPVIAIDHPSGLRSSYEPVISVREVGDLVQAGDAIGVTADPRTPGARLGHCSARCLHLGLRAQGVYIDPLLVIRSGAILLPQEQVP